MENIIILKLKMNLFFEKKIIHFAVRHPPTKLKKSTRCIMITKQYVIYSKLHAY
jgi:hypothetical protein